MSGTTYKMVVLGDRGVGKSALISQFIHKNFDSYYEPTIDKIFTHWIEIDNEMREIELYDTAGKEEFPLMRQHFIRKGIVFLCCQIEIFFEIIKHKFYFDIFSNL
jgi:small GTP-binding protein